MTSYQMIIHLAASACTQHQTKRCSYQTNLRVFVISRYRDGLAISTVFLNPPCDLELFGCVHRLFRQRLGVDGLARLVKENKVIGRERLDYLFPGRINVVIDLRGRRLGVFTHSGTKEATNASNIK